MNSGRVGLVYSKFSTALRQNLYLIDLRWLIPKIIMWVTSIDTAD